MALKFQNITAGAIKSLVPGKRITEHGIIAEKTLAGDVIYRIAIMVDGQRISRSVGKASEGVTRTQAEALIETLRTRAREDRLDLPKGRKSHPSFAKIAPAYLKRLGEIGGRNMLAKRQHIEHLFVPAFGTYRADKIPTSAIQDYVSNRIALGLKQATVNRELATLSHLFRQAIKWGWMKADSIPELRKGPEPRKQIVVLSDENASKLMKAAVNDQDPLLWLFVAFGLNTAMRHREILGVRYEDIDLDARRIFVPEAKAGEREQPITPSLASMIKSQFEIAGKEAIWLFPSRSSRATGPNRRNMSKSFLRAVVSAGLNPAKVTPHVMRHTAITRLVKAGVDLPTIQRISGHKTLAMVLRYVHIHGSHIDAAISAIDSAFTSELQMQPGGCDRLAIGA